MKPGLIIILGVFVVSLVLGLAIWGRKKRRRLEEEIRELDEKRIGEVHADALKRLKPSYPQLDPDDFNGTITWLERELKPSNDTFVGLLQRGDFFEFWVVNLGVFLGELMRKHALSPAEWVKDEAGQWKIRIRLPSGPFFWNPFEEVQKRYYKGEPADWFMALRLIQTLK